MRPLKILFLGTLILTLHHAARAERELTASEKKRLEKFESHCVNAKKKKAVCRCVSRNVKTRILSRDIDSDRLDHVVLIGAKATLEEEEKPSYYDSLADFLAGLESQCASNSKYQSE